MKFEVTDGDTVPSGAPMLLVPSSSAGTKSIVSCTSGNAGTERLGRSLAAADASGKLSAEKVPGQRGARDVEGAPSSSRPNSTCLGAGVNGASFCSARKEECVSFSCTLVSSPGRLPLSAICLEALCLFLGIGMGERCPN